MNNIRKRPIFRTGLQILTIFGFVLNNIPNLKFEIRDKIKSVVDRKRPTCHNSNRIESATNLTAQRYSALKFF